jgi:Cu/Ag efflux pump CusA
MVEKLIAFSLKNRIIVLLISAGLLGLGYLQCKAESY